MIYLSIFNYNMYILKIDFVHMCFVLDLNILHIDPQFIELIRLFLLFQCIISFELVSPIIIISYQY